MDQFRSPQAYNPAALSISSPRSLRPREDLQPATPRHYPRTPQALYVPPYSPESRTEDELDQSPPIQYIERARTQEVPSQGISSGRSADFTGGLVDNGLRRIRNAFRKHHSRESLHAQYLAEADAAAARYSQHYPSRGMSAVY